MKNILQYILKELSYVNGWSPVETVWQMVDVACPRHLELDGLLLDGVGVVLTPVVHSQEAAEHQDDRGQDAETQHHTR